MIIKKIELPEYTIYISNKKPTRTTSQNKYYWGVVLKTIADETGHHINDIHELMKKQFGLKKTISYETTDGVKVHNIWKSTTDYDTKEMAEYIETIRQWSQDFLNCRIPQANEIPDEYLIK